MILCNKSASRHYSIMGFTGIACIRLQMTATSTISTMTPLTKVRQRSILSLELDNKEKYECGASKTVHHEPRMDSTGKAQKERQTLPLCGSQEKQQNRVEIYSPTVKSRRNDRGASARKTSQNKIKPARCWQRTIKDLVAVTLPVTDWNPRTGKAQYSLPISFSIVKIDNIVNLLHKTVLKTWVCERKAIPMRPIMRYNGTSTSSPNDLLDMDFYLFLRKEITMPNNTSKQSYDIIRHRRGLLLYDPIQKKYVPNRRGRPKHFPLVKHVQQYLQKRGVA